MSILSLLGGGTIHRWLYAIAAFAGLGAILASFEPAAAPYLSLVANVGSLLSLLVVWRGGARDQRVAEAAIGSRSGHGSRPVTGAPGHRASGPHARADSR